MNRRHRAGETWNWLTDTGAWVLLIASSVVGMIGAWFILQRGSHMSIERVVFQLALAISTAIAMVRHDHKYGSDRVAKQKRIWHRMGRMFSTGISSMVTPAILWVAVKIIVEALRK